MDRPLYGLDIETDTEVDGLDPGVAAVVAVALSTDEHGDTVVTGSEAGLLAAVDACLADLPPGVLVTWNGSGFDLPFLADRARRCRVALGLQLTLDPSLAEPDRQPLAGHAGAYRARWHGHDHLDACRAWRALAPPGTACGLKAVARSVGFDPVSIDVARVHALSPAELRRYVTSDAGLARRVAALRWPALAAFVDGVGQVS